MKIRYPFVCEYFTKAVCDECFPDSQECYAGASESRECCYNQSLNHHVENAFVLFAPLFVFSYGIVLATNYVVRPH